MAQKSNKYYFDSQVPVNSIEIFAKLNDAGPADKEFVMKLRGYAQDGSEIEFASRPGVGYSTSLDSWFRYFPGSLEKGLSSLGELLADKEFMKLELAIEPWRNSSGSKFIDIDYMFFVHGSNVVDDLYEIVNCKEWVG